MKHLTLIIAFFLSQYCFAGWINMNTSINDDLNGVCFWSSAKGVVAGNKGIYYTTSGGTGAASWTRYNVTGIAADSAIYNATKFYGVAASDVDKAYFCGKDTVTGKAIVFYFDLSTLTYSIPYIGSVGSGLNSIYSYGGVIYAAGDNGLVLRSYLSPFVVVSTGTTVNLKSIKRNNTTVAVVGPDVFLSGTESGSSLSLSLYNHPGVNFGSAWPSSTDFYGVGTDAYLLSSGGSTLTTKYNHDPHPLNGNDIFYNYVSGQYYVATDHGIYKTYSGFANALEYQVTSGSNFFSQVIFNGADGYASGKNGLLLKTTDGGGPVRPYATMGVTINCLGTSSTLTGNPGSGTSCLWKLGSTNLGSGCTMSYSFTAAGIYTLYYIVGNTSGIYDTVSQTINVVNPPAINLSTSWSDSTLCKKQSIIINIATSQTDFTYQLKKFAASGTFGTIAGTGSPISMLTDSISQAGNYYIKVVSSLSQCTKSFTDTIPLMVEHTKADFSLGYINSYVGENVSLYENTTDAQNFLWTFPGTASISSSLLSDPTVGFNAAGSTSIKLVSWTNNGCYDSITKDGPMVNELTLPIDTCWAYVIDADNAAWTGVYTRDISQATKTKDNGYVICGTGYTTKYTSRNGITPPRTTEGGAYIAKYSNEGMLRWVHRTRDMGYTSYTLKPEINTVCTDTAGNIYFAGTSKESVFFYLQNGDSLKIANYPGTTPGTTNNFVGKLDPLGNLLWSGIFRMAYPDRIKIDNRNGDMIITGSFSASASYINGTTVTAIHPLSTSNYFVMRLDPSGNLKWVAPLFLNNTNGAGISDFACDKDGNLYLTGGYEYTSTFYSPDQTISKVITVPAGFYGSNFYLAKYDSLGIPKWEAHHHYSGSGSSGSGVVTDSLGNIYVTGSHFSSSSSIGMDLYNADGSFSTLYLGGYILFKFDPLGILNWSAGNQYSYSGNGEGITIKGDTISVVGVLQKISMPSINTYMTSVTGPGIHLSIGGSDIFIADYDLNGSLKDVFLSGINMIPNGMDERRSIFRDSEGRYFVAGDMRNSSPLVYCGDSITSNGLFEGFVAKFGIGGCNMNITTGLESDNQVGENELILFPNPSVNEFNIKTNKELIIGIKIFDISGRELFLKKFNAAEVRIQRNELNLSPGVYMVEISVESKKIIKKLLIQ